MQQLMQAKEELKKQIGQKDEQIIDLQSAKQMLVEQGDRLNGEIQSERDRADQLSSLLLK